MALLSWLDRVARLVRPEAVTSGWVLIVVVAVLVLGLRRQGRAFRPALSLGVFLIGASLSIVVVNLVGAPGPLVLGPVVVAVVAFVWWVLRGQGWTDALPRVPPVSVRWRRAGLGLIVVVTGALLAFRVTTYSGSLMTWEPSVVEGLQADLCSGTSVTSFAVERLLWHEGLVSSSHDSFWFGVPVYAMWRGLTPSLMSLRLVALAWALVGLAGVFSLGRRVLGDAGGLVAAAALAANAMLFFYGRYGVSLTATLAVVLLAAGLALHLGVREARPWWHGALLGMALLAATLAYSPARLVMLTLLTLVVLWAATRWRPFGRRHVLVLLALGGVLAAGVAAQVLTGHGESFLHARGEQLFNILTHPDYVRFYTGRDVHGRTLRAVEAAEVVVRVVQRTLPQYLRVLMPTPRFEGLAEQALVTDPPGLPLLAAPLVPFALLGLGRALRRWREPTHQLSLIWFCGCSTMLLLTTRADAHRMWLLVVPLTIWAGDGLLVLWRLGVAAGLGRRARGVAVGGLVAGLLVTALAYALPVEPPVYDVAPALIGELQRREQPLALGGFWDPREKGRVDLYLLARFARNPAQLQPSLGREVLESLAQEGGPDPIGLATLRWEIRKATVIMGPPEFFSAVVRELQATGYAVKPCAGTPARAWCIEQSERPGAKPPQPLESGLQVPLTSLRPLETSFGFDSPKLDQAWAGEGIRLAGVPYLRGIGMHAWCRMRFAIPEGAISFHSLVGIDDSARGCDHALAMARVLSDGDVVLFESELLDLATPPVEVTVPVEGRRHLTLEAGEGGNGRDCDHVSWAEPVFVMRTR